MEHKSTRKDRIKNITILFLSCMLLLTLFSNTIMNRNLVQVSTQAVTEEEITTKVRGNGTATSQETYEVKLEKKRRILTMDVKTGQTVNKGDLLFTLEEVDSEEVDKAKDTLDSARRTYESGVLTSGITVEERKEIEAAAIGSLTNRQTSIADVWDRLEKAENRRDDLKAQLEDIEKAVETPRYKMVAESLQHSLELLDFDIAALDKVADAEQIKNLEEQKRNINIQISNLKYYTDMSDLSVEAVDTSALKTAVKEADREVAALEKEKNKLQNLQAKQLSLMESYQALLKAQEAYEKAKGTIDGNTDVTAKISGTIVEIKYTAGNSVDAETAIMTIQPENKLATLSFSVTARQANRVKVGDIAEIMNNWAGDEINARVTSVKKEPSGDKFTVTCEMGGNGVVIGNNYTVSIGSQSARYDLVVPTSTIKTDNNGSFVLAITSKSTPLGNRYYATRVPVEVITSDDTKSAVTGQLTTADYVITTTTKPVAAGNQVRLAE